jgi:hypothetical protein
MLGWKVTYMRDAITINMLINDDLAICFDFKCIFMPKKDEAWYSSYRY